MPKQILTYPGYWMPFACAKAVCATFCAPIAGALIPIFGHDFPSQCISPGSPDHGRMAIDPAVVADSAREADMFRRMYVNANAVASNNQLPHHHPQQIHHYSHGPALPSPTSIPSPRLARRGVHRPGSPYDYDLERVDFGGRMRFKGGLDGPYGVAPESDPEIRTGPDTPPLHHVLHRGVPYSPMSPPRSSGWTAANHAARPHSSSVTPSSSYQQHGFREEMQYAGGPNPLLSAIPRLGHHAGLDHYQTSHRLPPISHAPAAAAAAAAAAAWNASKRPAPEVDADCGYDGQSESSPTTTVTTTTSRASAGRMPEDDGASQASSAAAASGVEKNAALLLMNLSVRDIREVWGQGDKENKRVEGYVCYPPRGCGAESVSMSPVSAAVATADGHRSKRRRATSM